MKNMDKRETGLPSGHWLTPLDGAVELTRTGILGEKQASRWHVGRICPHCECNLGKLFPGRKQKRCPGAGGNLESELEESMIRE